MSAPTILPTGLKRASLNTVWILLARLSSQGLMFGIGIMVARRLGEKGLGQFALVTAVVFTGNVFTTFGLDTHLIRHIARRQETRSAPLAPALIMQWGLSVLFIIVVWGAARWLSKGNLETTRALQLYVLSLLPLALTTIFSAALRAYERMNLYFTVSFVTAVFQTGTAFIYLNGGGELIGLMAWLLVGQLVAAVFSSFLCQVALPNFTINWQLINLRKLVKMVRLGTILVLLMGLSVLYQRLGVFLLSALGNEAQTGWFSAALRLVDAVKIVPFAFFGALFPIMARQTTSGIKAWYRAAILGLIGMVLTAIIVFYWLDEWLIVGLYGPSYQPAIRALRILAWSLLPFIVSLYLTFSLVATRKEKTALIATAVSLISTTFIGVIRYNASGFYGICQAVVLGEIIQSSLLITIIYGRKRTANSCCRWFFQFLRKAIVIPATDDISPGNQ